MIFGPRHLTVKYRTGGWPTRGRGASASPRWWPRTQEVAASSCW